MIKFKTLKWKNFLSTGNVYTELELDRNPSTLVIGDNGAGKSTFLDVLSFALYGKPFRKVNKNQLINSINKKDLRTEVVFHVGKHIYKIIRGAKPNIFEIWQNGKLINQDANARDYQDYLEKNILKLTHKAFSQVVVLGSTSFVPFMQLNSIHRREVIEDLLDLQIFSVMNTLLKERVNKNEKELQEIEFNVRTLEEKIKLTEEHIESLDADNQTKIRNNLYKVEENNKEIEALNSRVTVLNSDIDNLNKGINDQDTVKNRYEKLKELRVKLNSKILDLKNQLSFYQENESCPTCNQEIDTQFKEDIVCSHNNKLSEINDGIEKMQQELKDAEDRIEAIMEDQQKIISLQNDIKEMQWKESTLQDQCKSLLLENSELTDSKGSKAKKLEQLDKFISQKEKVLLSKVKKINDRNILSVISVMLKDSGIKTKIIKQYVPIMNKLINKYLAAMDFFVQFELDESFNETIRSRFRDDFSYASFSEGEKMRIDLSLLFTWRSIAKIRNSASTNLLIMDEVFDSSLDSSGTDEFLKLLNELTSDTNVFIISHKGDTLIDKFKHVLKFEKVKSFSRLAE